MEIEEYKKLSEKTLSGGPKEIDEKTINLLHGAMGLSTEANEILDHLKKVVFYGKEVDIVNIKEEIGDLMWYMAIFLRELDIDFYESLEININKLKARYGEKFSSEAALNRDLDKERKILEKA